MSERGWEGEMKSVLVERSTGAQILPQPDEKVTSPVAYAARIWCIDADLRTKHASVRSFAEKLEVRINEGC